jgi:HK97 family phage major capsid protein
MAITAPRGLADFEGFLTPEQSAPIFEKAADASVVMRLGQQVPLGATGRAIPVFTGDVAAGWVAEGGQKPATEGAMDLKIMEPKKLAAIFVQSAEVVRANPGNYLTVMRTKVAEAFAAAFDAAALHGTSSPFDDAIDDTTKSVELGTATSATGGVYADIVAGLDLLVTDEKDLTGFAIDPMAEPILLGAVDTSGRPIFVDTPPVETAPAVRPGRLIGRPSLTSKGVAAGTTNRIYGGDWSQVAWGVVGGISYSVSTEATVTINGVLTSLWERNLVAVLAEAEYGLVVNDPEAFVQYVDAV